MLCRENVSAKTVKQSGYSPAKRSFAGIPEACNAITNQVMVRIGQNGPEQSRNRIPRLGNMCGMHRRDAMQSPWGDGSIGPDRARQGEWPDGASVQEKCAGGRQHHHTTAPPCGG